MKYCRDTGAGAANCRRRDQNAQRSGNAWMVPLFLKWKSHQLTISFGRAHTRSGIRCSVHSQGTEKRIHMWSCLRTMLILLLCSNVVWRDLNHLIILLNFTLTYHQYSGLIRSNKHEASMLGFICSKGWKIKYTKIQGPPAFAKFLGISHLLTQDKAKEGLKVQLSYQLENHTTSGRHTVLRMQFLPSIIGSCTPSFKGGKPLYWYYKNLINRKKGNLQQ